MVKDLKHLKLFLEKNNFLVEAKKVSDIIKKESGWTDKIKGFFGVNKPSKEESLDKAELASPISPGEMIQDKKFALVDLDGNNIAERIEDVDAFKKKVLLKGSALDRDAELRVFDVISNRMPHLGRSNVAIRDLELFMYDIPDPIFAEMFSEGFVSGKPLSEKQKSGLKDSLRKRYEEISSDPEKHSVFSRGGKDLEEFMIMLDNAKKFVKDDLERIEKAKKYFNDIIKKDPDALNIEELNNQISLSEEWAKNSMQYLNDISNGKINKSIYRAEEQGVIDSDVDSESLEELKYKMFERAKEEHLVSGGDGIDNMEVWEVTPENIRYYEDAVENNYYIIDKDGNKRYFTFEI